MYAKQEINTGFKVSFFLCKITNLLIYSLYLNNSIFIAKFSETAKFIYKLAKFVFSEHIVVFYKVFCHNIFPLD
mgnify:CR=1 FL=1